MNSKGLKRKELEDKITNLMKDVEKAQKRLRELDEEDEEEEIIRKKPRLEIEEVKETVLEEEVEDIIKRNKKKNLKQYLMKIVFFLKFLKI
jgi:hypothetical protein